MKNMFYFIFSSRIRHTRFALFSWARRCINETESMGPKKGSPWMPMGCLFWDPWTHGPMGPWSMVPSTKYQKSKVQKSKSPTIQIGYPEKVGTRNKCRIIIIIKKKNYVELPYFPFVGCPIFPLWAALIVGDDDDEDDDHAPPRR